MEADMIQLTNEPINVNSIIDTVRDESCGGIDVFIGTVRNTTQQREVSHLEFEAYEPMAIKELYKIAEYAQSKWSLKNVSIVHRLGLLKIGEEAVVIAVAAPHRAAAFEGCRYIIDTLKKTVPIWKKEVFTDGEVWVSAYP